MKTAYRTKKRQTHTGWLVVAFFVIVAATITTLELTNRTYIFHKRPPKPQPQTASQSTKGEPLPSPTTTSGNPSSSSGSSSTTQPGDQKSDTGGSTTTNLLVPSGDFVSAHTVSLTSTLSSVCNTSPGASCTISFTNSAGVHKSLTTTTTDRGGSAYWNSWTPQSIGLTAGSWQITATASLSGQTRTTTDAKALVVS